MMTMLGLMLACALSAAGFCLDWIFQPEQSKAPIAVTATPTPPSVATVKTAPVQETLVQESATITSNWVWSDTVIVLTPGVEIFPTGCKDEMAMDCSRWNVYVEGVYHHGVQTTMPNNAILVRTACKIDGAFVNDAREEYGIPEGEYFVRGFTARPCDPMQVSTLRASEVMTQASNATTTLIEIPTPSPVLPEIGVAGLVTTTAKLQPCEGGESLCWNAYTDNNGVPMEMTVACKQDGAILVNNKEVVGVPPGTHMVLGITVRKCQ